MQTIVVYNNPYQLRRSLTHGGHTMNRALTLTDADFLTLLSLIANRRHLCTTELNNPHYADDHAEIRAEFDDLGRLYRVVALAVMLPESSTAPVVSTVAGGVASGAAGGAA